MDKILKFLAIVEWTEIPSLATYVIYCAVLVTDKNLLQNRPEQFKIRTFYLDQIDKYNLKRSTNEILKWFSI